MNDLFGNTSPVQIEIGEWWFNGRVIQQNNHPKLSRFVSWNDTNEGFQFGYHATFDAAVLHCLSNPCTNPERLPKNYIGGM